MNKGITRKEVRERLKKYEISIDDLDKTAIISFKEDMKKLSDSRQKSKRVYKIWDVIVTAFIAVLANQDTWEEIHDFVEVKYDFFKSFLKMTGGVPSAKTYERIFAVIKPEELENICVLFVIKVLKIFKSERDIMSIDGKVDRGSSRNENELRDKIKPLNVLNVYSNNYGICIASEMIDDKTNEITAVPTILSRINAKDAIITWDALNTTKKNVSTVIEHKADYVVALKKNCESFYEDLEIYFDDDKLDMIKAGALKSTYGVNVEKANSNIITYEYFQTEDVKWYHDISSWKSLNSFGLVRKTIERNGNKTVEKRFYISSLFNDIALFSKAIRNHWGVENNLHWQLDYTFKMDNNTTMNKNALFNLQLIKKLALAIIKNAKDVYHTSLSAIRNRLSINFEVEILRLLNIITH
jgi:Transposase